MTRRSTTVAWLALLTALTGPAAAQDVTPYYSRSAFIAATGATVKVSYRHPRDATPHPYVESGISLVSPLNYNNFVKDNSPVLPGNDFVASSYERLDIALPEPVRAFGIELHDNVNTLHPGTGRGGATIVGENSVFNFTFMNGATVIGSLTVDPTPDVAYFAGVVTSQPFNRVEVREVVGDIENDFFGRIYTAVDLVPLPSNHDAPANTAFTGSALAPMPYVSDTGIWQDIAAVLDPAGVAETAAVRIDGTPLALPLPETVAAQAAGPSSPPATPSPPPSAVNAPRGRVTATVKEAQGKTRAPVTRRVPPARTVEAAGPKEAQAPPLARPRPAALLAPGSAQGTPSPAPFAAVEHLPCPAPKPPRPCLRSRSRTRRRLSSTARRSTSPGRRRDRTAAWPCSCLQRRPAEAPAAYLPSAVTPPALPLTRQVMRRRPVPSRRHGGYGCRDECGRQHRDSSLHRAEAPREVTRFPERGLTSSPQVPARFGDRDETALTAV